MTDQERIERLEARVARERRAREEAEAIAERGMRDLWLVNRSLEERVAERTAELSQSVRAARVAADAKEAFLAELGHELATPIHAVIGLVELIDASVLGGEDRHRLEQIEENARALSELLVGLVEIAGASGDSRPDDVANRSPLRWLDETVDRWVKPAAGRGQLLVPSCEHGEDELALDWARLGRMVDVVLDNVVQHAGPGPVDIGVDVDVDTVTVVVRDAGPGMSAEQIASAAEPFVRQGEGRSLGIGLAIACRLAESAGGSFQLASDDESWTHVSMSLPRLSAAA